MKRQKRRGKFWPQKKGNFVFVCFIFFFFEFFFREEPNLTQKIPLVIQKETDDHFHIFRTFRFAESDFGDEDWSSSRWREIALGDRDEGLTKTDIQMF